MAKFGYLFLNEGNWDGKQLISKEWVKQSTKTWVTLSPTDGYGYQWWTYPNSGILFANGAFGQRIYVLPKSELVVVFTADMRFVNPDPIMYELIHDYVIPANGQ